MIDEAWARRRYEAVFCSKLSEALGEATETQVWLDHAVDASYLTAAEHEELDAAWAEIGALLQGMIDRSASFCGRGSDSR